MGVGMRGNSQILSHRFPKVPQGFPTVSQDFPTLFSGLFTRLFQILYCVYVCRVKSKFNPNLAKILTLYSICLCMCRFWIGYACMTQTVTAGYLLYRDLYIAGYLYIIGTVTAGYLVI